jgi:cell division protein FtsN
MANLTPQQRQLVEQWAAEGASLNQIQDRLRSECATTLTYMETRLLIMELGVKIQDKPREKPPEEKSRPRRPNPPWPTKSFLKKPPRPAEAPVPGGELKVTVDEVPPEGAVISGKATFSDGNTVMWFMDQMGRFGMRGPAPGYQPPPADIPAFQRELDRILSSAASDP